jgi:hypothetical protein
MYRFNTAGMVSRVASQEGFEKAGGRTADPSTSLRFGRDDKGRAVAQVGVVSGMGRKSRSTKLRFGRDDKGRGVAVVGVVTRMDGPAASPATSLASGAVRQIK